VLNKSFHSDPDLRKDSTEDSGKSTGAKLDLEIKIKHIPNWIFREKISSPKTLNILIVIHTMYIVHFPPFF
jgi:hypothetical protein